MDLGNIAGNLESLPKLTEIWNDVHEHNWPALIQAIKDHRGDDGGKHDELLGKAESAATEAQDQGKPFPDSPSDLLKLIQH